VALAQQVSAVAEWRLAQIAAIEEAARVQIERIRAEMASALERPAMPADTIATLLDLARAGREADVRWLAASAGVKPGDLDALSTGTLARLDP